MKVYMCTNDNIPGIEQNKYIFFNAGLFKNKNIIIILLLYIFNKNMYVCVYTCMYVYYSVY